MEKTTLGPQSYILTPKEVDSKAKNIGRAYLRCSTNYQVKDNGSIEVQLKVISDYAKGKDITIAGFYVDEAISGAKGLDERLAFKALEADILKGETVLFSSVSRIGRNVAFVSNFMEEMKKKKISVHVAEIGDITGDQEFMFNMMVAVAVQERQIISKRVSTAMKYISEKGELKCRPKFGERHNGTKRGFEPDPEAMKVIDVIRELRGRGLNYTQVMRELQRDYPAKNYGKNEWYVNDITRLCKRHEIA